MAGYTSFGALAARFRTGFASSMVGCMGAALGSTPLTGFGAKLAQCRAETGITRHEGHAETAKIGTIPACTNTGAHIAQIEAGATALFALYETGQTGFNTLFQGCITH